eukprot:scaffold1330_cov240-Pinguiococcus_pyrenoidosus.AAC.40
MPCFAIYSARAWSTSPSRRSSSTRSSPAERCTSQRGRYPNPLARRCRGAAGSPNACRVPFLAAQVGPRGFLYDRQWLIVKMSSDSEKRAYMVTQRQNPHLATIAPSLPRGTEASEAVGSVDRPTPHAQRPPRRQRQRLADRLAAECASSRGSARHRGGPRDRSAHLVGRGRGD